MICEIKNMNHAMITTSVVHRCYSAAVKKTKNRIVDSSENWDSSKLFSEKELITELRKDSKKDKTNWRNKDFLGTTRRVQPTPRHPRLSSRLRRAKANTKVPADTVQKSDEKVPAQDAQQSDENTWISSSKLAAQRYAVDGQPAVPPLANDLDKVLFNPGVHFLKDPRTNVYNFDYELENIMSIKDFDFTRIPKFVPASKDASLAKLGAELGKKYTGSTSSLTSALTQIHHAISHWRPPQLMSLSKYFPGRTTTFTSSQRAPAVFNLRFNKNSKIWSVESDHTHDEEIILSLLGQTMETMLTTDSKTFALYDRTRSDELPRQDVRSTYNYLDCGQFLMRSQLDCYDPRLPGSGYFDLKTRAVCAVRHDIDYAQIHDGLNYQIMKKDGFDESFAREFFELIRSAMFKYSLQARIGSMDGIFVAYHNIKTLFGFEYLPLAEIDKIFHTSHLLTQNHGKNTLDLDTKMSQVGPLIADREFKLSTRIFELILDTLLNAHPDHKEAYSIALTCRKAGVLAVLAKPMQDKDISIADSGEPVQDLQEYTPKADPYTLYQHFMKDSHGWTPPDALAFTVKLENVVNGQKISPDQHPALESENDEWNVGFSMREAKATDWYSVMKKQVVHHHITSKVITERLENEADLRATALKNLPEPTKFQERLRELTKKGELYKAWDDAREKTRWVSGNKTETIPTPFEGITGKA